MHKRSFNTSGLIWWLGSHAAGQFSEDSLTKHCKGSRDNFRCVEYSNGEKSVPWALENFVAQCNVGCNILQSTFCEANISTTLVHFSTQHCKDSLSLRTARSAPPLLWCCWGRARQTKNVYLSELVPTNSDTARSASVCRTTVDVDDARPKWSSHLQITKVSVS